MAKFNIKYKAAVQYDYTTDGCTSYMCTAKSCGPLTKIVSMTTNIKNTWISNNNLSTYVFNITNSNFELSINDTETSYKLKINNNIKNILSSSSFKSFFNYPSNYNLIQISSKDYYLKEICSVTPNTNLTYTDSISYNTYGSTKIPNFFEVSIDVIYWHANGDGSIRSNHSKPNSMIRYTFNVELTDAEFVIPTTVPPTSPPITTVPPTSPPFGMTFDEICEMFYQRILLDVSNCAYNLSMCRDVLLTLNIPIDYNTDSSILTPELETIYIQVRDRVIANMQRCNVYEFNGVE